MGSRNAFALHEFGSLEFALDSAARTHSTGFAGDASSTVMASAVALANALTQDSGESLLNFIGNAFHNSHLHTTGIGEMEGSTVLVRNTTYGGQGQALMNASSGVGIGVTFSANGEATLDFLILDGYEYHIQGSSAVVLLSSAIAQPTFTLVGEATPTLLASALISADTLIQGQSSVLTRVQGLSAANMSVRGDSGALFLGQLVQTASAQAQGEGSLLGRSQKINATSVQVQGEASFTAPALRAVLAHLQAQGISQSAIQTDSKQYLETLFGTAAGTSLIAQGVLVVHGQFLGQSESSAIWYRGRNTQPFLITSSYTTVRPRDIRKALWKL
jgi:hypothetical protein